MKRYLVLIVAVTLIVGAAGIAKATSYSGSLNAGTNGGILATAPWNSSSTVFSWTVTDVGTQNGFVLWKYEYTLTVPEKNISHINIELSEGSVQGDFTVLSPPTTPNLDYMGIVGNYSSANGNPGMPSAFNPGIKFGQPSPLPTGGFLSGEYVFTTTRSPVWGDFYAKDGKHSGNDVTAWNTGFTSTDPTVGPSSGSVDFHILRPDTGQTAAVPEPASLILLGISLIGIGTSARRRVKI